MTSNAEKVFLIFSIVISWGFGFLVYTVLAGSFSLQVMVGMLFGGALLWLAPFALLALISDEIGFSLGAFALGSLGFLFVAFNWYIALGLLLLLIGFAYWFLYARYGKNSVLRFSVTQILQGIGIFFTALALFGALLYYYSSLASRGKQEPVIPEKFFDIIYHPISQILLSQLPVIPHSQAPDPELLKPQIYRMANDVLAETAKKYQEYIPFAFAAAAFFALRAALFPFKYIFLAFTFLLVKFFIKIGLLKKETVQVEKEIVKF